MSVRAISLHQPWASLLALGEKRFETRGWHTAWRGTLLVHASRQRATLADCERPAIAAALARHGYYRPSDLPQSCLLARAELAGCIPTERRLATFTRLGIDAELEEAFGDYRPGRYFWLLAELVPLLEPLEAAGRQGLWVPDAELAAAALGDPGYYPHRAVAR